MYRGARRGPNVIFSHYESDVIPIGDPVIITGIDMNKPHCFGGIKFYSNSEGTIQAIPTTGIVTIKIQTLNSEPIFEDPPSSIINPLFHNTISWAANTILVRATPSGIDIATHYQLVVTCNET